MPGEDAFQVEGRVIEALPNSTYRVELANGHGYWRLCRAERNRLLPA